ncbi:TPA: HNH endonuclease, partial [Klebsiella aerogenes]|nr:HNH endonuclease [Klebsiella aerogenes]
GLNVYQYAPNPLGWVDPWGLTGKPLNSPDISKWLNKGGTVWQEVESKVWVYQDSAGNVVRYPEGFPDFTPYERQSVNVPDLRGDHSKSPGGDFGKADALAPKGQANYDLNTWHHHQNGITMQEVPKNIHRRFTHRGGVSKIKSNCQ